MHNSRCSWILSLVVGGLLASAAYGQALPSCAAPQSAGGNHDGTGRTGYCRRSGHGHGCGCNECRTCKPPCQVCQPPPPPQSPVVMEEQGSFVAPPPTGAAQGETNRVGFDT